MSSSTPSAWTKFSSFPARADQRLSLLSMAALPEKPGSAPESGVSCFYFALHRSSRERNIGSLD